MFNLKRIFSTVRSSVAYSLDTQKRWSSSGRRKEGFTLVEILAVIVLLSLLLGAAVPFFGWARDKAVDDNACNRAILLNSAKSQYLLEYGRL